MTLFGRDKELILEPVHGEAFQFDAGDYIQLVMPPHETWFKTFDIPEPYRDTWQAARLFNCYARNPVTVRRNYSMANNPDSESRLCFNVRIATPPPGQAYSAGVGSSYVFNNHIDT